MSAPTGFVADLAPSQKRRSALAERYPENPFCTPAYARAMQAEGVRALLLGFENADGELLEGCYGFRRDGRLVRELNLPSLPRFADATGWEAGLAAWCGREVDRVVLGSFGVPETALPRLDGRVTRWSRREYVLDLAPADDLSQALSSNHRRNVRRAREAGLVFRERTDADAATSHLRLVSNSLKRREARGEEVTTAGEAGFFRRLLDTGSGTCVQALDGDEVLSSILVLRSARGAYYQSAGTGPRGMQCGAAAFLVVTAAERLRDQGVRTFNLGGAGEGQEGLQRFKAGFGAHCRELEAGRALLGSPIRHTLAAAAAALCRSPSAFARQLLRSTPP